MRPLSRTRRRVYVWLFAALFLVSVPFALLYAAGYRYKAGYGLVETGGIFISVPYADAVVSLNGNEIGESGLLNKSFYINDLAPSAYVLHIARASSTPWYRTLVVEPKIVTEVRAVLPPEEVETVVLMRGGSSTSSVRAVSIEQYDAYIAAFGIAATSTGSVRGVQGIVENGDVFVQWVDEEKSTPDSFCERPSDCTREFAIEDGRQAAVSVALWNDGIVYSTREGGVFFAEIDIRPTPVTIPLYARPRADARVVDGSLFIQDADMLHLVEPF